jgi:hypothetical protein
MKNNKDIIDVSFEDFDALVIEASKQRPILIDLWAQWCPPCHVVAPALARISHRNLLRLPNALNLHGVLPMGSSTDCKYAYVALRSVRRESSAP